MDRKLAYQRRWWRKWAAVCGWSAVLLESRRVWSGGHTGGSLGALASMPRLEPPSFLGGQVSAHPSVYCLSENTHQPPSERRD